MMPAANQGVGMNMGFPDVCLTPAGPVPVPVPYPNIGMNAMAMPFVPNVLVSMAPAQNMAAKPLMTNGDNAGVLSPCMLPGGTTMGNPRILIGGMPAAHLCVPTYGNNFINPVGAKLVPSVTNVLLGAVLSDARRLHTAAGRVSWCADAVAVVALPQLWFGAAAWLRNALRRLTAVGARGVVLDLRGNPGGPLREAAGIASALSAHAEPQRLAVVVDRHTASAAEMLAASLQDRGGVPLVGERSFGKGQVAAFAVDGDALVRRGAARAWRRATGAALDDVGVSPDLSCTRHEAVAVARQLVLRS
jgi:carboxyl-terminal processing protease